MTTKPEEMVILRFNEKSRKRYEIVHLNKLGPGTTLEGPISRNVSIADYAIGGNRPNGYLIGKRYDSRIRGVIKDVVVVPEGNPIEEKVYNFALKEALEYAREKDLKFEDHSGFIQNPFPHHPPSGD